MNDTSTSPIIMGLLFVLRCLVPLGLLLGVSYLLRRMELIRDHEEEDENIVQNDEADQQTPDAPEIVMKPVLSPMSTSGKEKKGGKKKTITPKKKES